MFLYSLCVCIYRFCFVLFSRMFHIYLYIYIYFQFTYDLLNAQYTFGKKHGQRCQISPNSHCFAAFPVPDQTLTSQPNYDAVNNKIRIEVETNTPAIQWCWMSFLLKPSLNQNQKQQQQKKAIKKTTFFKFNLLINCTQISTKFLKRVNIVEYSVEKNNKNLNNQFEIYY